MRPIRFLLALAALSSAVVTAVATADADQLDTSAFGCTEWESDTLAELGISVVADPSCIHDGQGCIGTSCRFCRTKDTLESMMYDPCSAVTATPVPSPTPSASAAVAPIVSTAIVPVSIDACATWLSEGDKAAGIAVTGDTSCVVGGVGCIGLQCRYCRERDTPQSNHFLECTTVRGGVAVSLPTQATPSPSPASTVAGADACSKWLSTGDRAVGVSIFGDTTCAAGGVGCIGDTTCRYCRVKDSDQSRNFVPCPGASPATSMTPTTSQVSSGKTETCAKFSTVGDRAVGIEVANDASCARGGTGCVGDACRFCRSASTSQSSHLLPCSGLPSGSAVVRVEALSAQATPDGQKATTEVTGPPHVVVAALVFAGVAAAIGALAFVVKSKSTVARWHDGALAAPMCIEQQQSASLADI